MTDPYNSLGAMDPNIHPLPPTLLRRDLTVLRDIDRFFDALDYTFSALPMFRSGARWPCTIPPGYGRDWV